MVHYKYIAVDIRRVTKVILETFVRKNLKIIYENIT